MKFSQPVELLAYLSLLFLHEEEEPVVEALHHAALHLAQKHVLERAGALHAARPVVRGCMNRNRDSNHDPKSYDDLSECLTSKVQFHPVGFKFAKTITETETKYSAFWTPDNRQCPDF